MYFDDETTRKSYEKYGYIDKSGNEVIPIKYRNAFSFKEGLAMVELSDNRGFFDKSNKWGFIDKNGKVVIPLKYSDLYDFREGLARVVLNDKYGYIGRDGTEYFED